MRRALVLAGAVAALVPACAYFNSLYNAKRLFAEAERASARGERSAAFTAYGAAVEKAARSLHKSPDGRWADDALYLIGRAHFARGDYLAARAALDRLRAETSDAGMRASAAAYLGAVEFRLANYTAARAHLETALEPLQGSQLAAFAHLWRARVAVALGDDAGAWPDLEAAAASEGAVGREARLELASRAVAIDEPERALAAFHSLLRDDRADRTADSLRVLAGHAARRWGPSAARELLAPAERAPWSGDQRHKLTLFRAELAAMAGDTATAAAEARAVAGAVAGPVADRARVTLARWQLGQADDFDDLDDVRATLLPAIADADARRLIQATKALGVLLEQAREMAQPLALFAAAELARDELGAPALARLLFLAYADLVPGATWAPKALLAAAGLGPDADQAATIRERLEHSRGNVYVAALERNGTAGAFEDAEERLARTLGMLRQEAEIEADRRDAVVVRAAALLDSARAAARTDTLRLACGAFIDSLGIAGIRADSVRAACIRRDSASVDSFMMVDTLLLRDSTRVRADTLARMPDAVRDTM